MQDAQKHGFCGPGLHCDLVVSRLPHACRLGSGGFASGYSSKLTRGNDSYAVLKVGGWQVRACMIQPAQVGHGKLVCPVLKDKAGRLLSVALDDVFQCMANTVASHSPMTQRAGVVAPLNLFLDCHTIGGLVAMMHHPATPAVAWHTQASQAGSSTPRRAALGCR